jgi:hypothetical protein
MSCALLRLTLAIGPDTFVDRFFDIIDKLKNSDASR